MNTPVIRILLLAALLAPASASGQSIPTRHNEATVAELQAEMASHNLTSEELGGTDQGIHRPHHWSRPERSRSQRGD